MEEQEGECLSALDALIKLVRLVSMLELWLCLLLAPKLAASICT